MKRIALLALLAAGCAGAQQNASPEYFLSTQVSRQGWNGHGHVYSTAHYRIFTTVTRGDLVERLPGFMEAANDYYRRVTGLSDQPTAGPLPIYMFASRREWADMTQKVVPPGAVDIYLNIQAGGYCFGGVCVFWDLGSLYTYSLAAHEGLHQFLGKRLRQRLPNWLEEGLCTTVEGLEMGTDRVRFTPQRNVTRFADLRNALARQWVPLDKLLVMDAGDAIVNPSGAAEYYAQVWCLALFLRSDETYRAGLHRLLADAEKGTLHQAIGVTPEQFAAFVATGRDYNKHVSTRLFKAYFDNDPVRFEKAFRAFAMNVAYGRQ